MSYYEDNRPNKQMKAITFKIRLAEEHHEEDVKAFNRFLSEAIIGEKHIKFVPGEEEHWSILLFYNEPVKPRWEAGTFRKHPEDFEKEEYDAMLERANALTEWKTVKAKEMNIPIDYLKFSAKAIDVLAETNPKTLGDLHNITGITKGVKNELGEEIIEILKDM